MNPRNLVFQIHLWVGLSLGILFVLIGLSGTGMMFRTIPGIGQRVPQIRATTAGPSLPLERIAAAARQAVPAPSDAATTILLPREAGMPAQVRFVTAAAPGRGAAGRRPADPDVLVDPAGGQVLGRFTPGMTPAMRFIHDLHGGLLLGRPGRVIVGWVGVAMTFLGLSGLYLWWPRAGQWKTAFGVRRKARGLRLHRELHGAAGIWGAAVLVVVSFTGVAIVFPESIRTGFSTLVEGGDRPAVTAPRGQVRAPAVPVVRGAARLDADGAIAVARRANPGMTVQSVTLPPRPDQAIIVTLGDGRGRPVFVDPYRGRMIATAAGGQPSALDKVMAALRPLHEGGLLGPVYRVAVMVSGLLPALFVFTGLMMWLKKRRNRIANRPLAAEALEPAE